MRYSLSQDMIFVVLALISTLALLSQETLLATIFFALAILFVSLENRIYEYVRSA